ncbi:MAG: hypothetical protein MUF15_23850 [Acidobacteria bacterium]|nr:hypothetical protein [Acidobacteriota bacterium]
MNNKNYTEKDFLEWLRGSAEFHLEWARYAQFGDWDWVAVCYYGNMINDEVAELVCDLQAGDEQGN